MYVYNINLYVDTKCLWFIIEKSEILRESFFSVGRKRKNYKILKKFYRNLKYFLKIISQKILFLFILNNFNIINCLFNISRFLNKLCFLLNLFLMFNVSRPSFFYIYNFLFKILINNNTLKVCFCVKSVWNNYLYRAYHLYRHYTLYIQI